MINRRRTRPRGKGQALVELALALPILLLVILAVFEAGVLAFTLMTVGHAAQDGGRLAALPSPPDGQGPANEAEVKTYVIDRAGFAPVSIAATDIAITISGCATPPCTFLARDSGDRVHLTVNYTYNPIIAIIFGSGTTFSMTAQTEYYVE